MNLSAVRATSRIARRNIARHRGRSVLIALLVLLPVAGMVAAIAILRTTTPTRDQFDTSRLGRADLLAYGDSEEELRKHLPVGSVMEPVLQANARLVLEGARPGVNLRGIPLRRVLDSEVSDQSRLLAFITESHFQQEGELSGSGVQ